MRELVARFVFLLLLPLSIYILSFVIHFHMLPHYGPGAPFHEMAFNCRFSPPAGLQLDQQKGVADRLHADARCKWSGCPACEAVRPLGMWSAIVSLNRRMLSANAGVTRKHAFGSGWLDWPFNMQPVFYWQMVSRVGWWFYALVAERVGVAVMATMAAAAGGSDDDVPTMALLTRRTLAPIALPPSTPPLSTHGSGTAMPGARSIARATRSSGCSR